MNYVLFFGSFLLVIALSWLTMDPAQESAPGRTYRNALLVGAGLMSAAWLLLRTVHLVPSWSLPLVFLGALAGGIVTTAVDVGLVRNVTPPLMEARAEESADHLATDPPAPPKPLVNGVCEVGAALIALVLTLPLWIVIAGLIWLEDPGPIFVVEKTAGRQAGAHRLLRFRSVRSDARILAVGGVLRRWRLDDLPQLAHVLVFAIRSLELRRRGGARRSDPATALSRLRLRAAARRPVAVASALLLVAAAAVAGSAPAARQSRAAKRPTLAAPLVVPQLFDPNQDAVLPKHRVVAFYGVPGAAATGPAWTLDAAMLDRLRAQGAEYERLDPAHPVALGIDLVASVPDSDPGPGGTYSHRLDAATMDRYLEFCRTNRLLLFLDLSFGWSDPRQELEHFLPYLALPFVHLAIDPEWMFPRHNGIPGDNLSNVRAADINPLITAMAELPARHRIPRKIVILHQYRPTGDGLADPYSPGAAEIADKGNLVKDPRVDLVVHVDSVGGWAGDIQVKVQQYGDWVRRDMGRFGNFQYGGFKIFYQLESKNRLMTAAEVMSLNPPPMVVTYGN